VKAITDHGRILIPAAEVERILAKAGTYDGLKVKVKLPKAGSKLEAWRKFLDARRKSSGKRSKRIAAKVPSGLSAARGNQREAVLARLTRPSSS
jgi:hypothetical protein